MEVDDEDLYVDDPYNSPHIIVRLQCSECKAEMWVNDRQNDGPSAPEQPEQAHPRPWEMGDEDDPSHRPWESEGME